MARVNGINSNTGDYENTVIGNDYLEIAQGNVEGHSIIHKFGQYNTVGTSFTPVARLGLYNTLKASEATTLRIKAGGHANDTAAGDGAREVTLEGIDETGALCSETVATNGASASTATTTTFIRLFRFYVSASGTYATASAGSHAGLITIENGAGGTDWGEISFADFPRSQSEIGAYTIPVGYTGYLISAYGFCDATKITDLIMFKREDILGASAPYEAMKVVFEERSEGGAFTAEISAPIRLNSNSNGCDIGFMAKVSAQSAEVEVDFEIILIAD